MSTHSSAGLDQTVLTDALHEDLRAFLCWNMTLKSYGGFLARQSRERISVLTSLLAIQLSHTRTTQAPLTSESPDVTDAILDVKGHG